MEISHDSAGADYRVSADVLVSTQAEAETLARRWVADMGGTVYVYERRAHPWAQVKRVATYTRESTS